jgi:DNA adenine methylase
MAKTQKKYLKASWPAFGGKAAVAKMVWERFGNVQNMIEPFCNSAAIMLKNPLGPAHYETINDLNCYVANYWRSVKHAPDQVAEHSDYIVSEVDLHARHRYLVASPDTDQFRKRMLSEPEYYDPKFAGWWAWGNCLWIGSGWCQKLTDGRPQLADARALGRGVHAGGVSQQWQQIPLLTTAHSRGRGVHSNDSAGTCEERRAWLNEWMKALSDRFRNVRVCCGEWDRVCKSPSVTTRLGVTGVFLDPPYPVKVKGKASRKKGLYATDQASDLDQLAKDVYDYCLKRGKESKMRIAVCGLAGEAYESLAGHGWTEVQWKSSGYQNRSESGQVNATRERIWFNKSCLVPERDICPLFKDLDESEENS